jgi:hypothetical protein
MAFRLFGKAGTAGVKNAFGVKTAKMPSPRFGLSPAHLSRRTQMLTTEATEKAIALYEIDATELAVAEATGISHEEAKAVADALYLAETDRLSREVALAGVLEAAAAALRSGRGIGDTAGDVVREIWHSHANAEIKTGDADRKAAARASGVDQAETKKDLS